MVCPLFTDNSPDDDFLLAFIGVLDELYVPCPLFFLPSPAPIESSTNYFVGDDGRGGLTSAPSSNFAAMIKKRNFREGIAFEHLDYYVERGKKVCFKFGIKVSRGTPYHDPGKPPTPSLSFLNLSMRRARIPLTKKNSRK